jgi:hypothetical protein
VHSRKHSNNGRNVGNGVSPVEGTNLKGAVLKMLYNEQKQKFIAKVRSFFEHALYTRGCTAPSRDTYVMYHCALFRLLWRGQCLKCCKMSNKVFTANVRSFFLTCLVQPAYKSWSQTFCHSHGFANLLTNKNNATYQQQMKNNNILYMYLQAMHISVKQNNKLTYNTRYAHLIATVSH